MTSDNKTCIKIIAGFLLILALGYAVESYGCEGTDMKKYYICEGGFCKR